MMPESSRRKENVYSFREREREVSWNCEGRTVKFVSDECDSLRMFIFGQNHRICTTKKLLLFVIELQIRYGQ